MTIEVGGRLPATQYAPPLVSWDDYLRWALANEFSSEWVDGRIIDRLPQNLRSNLIVQFLLDTIRRYVEPKGLERLLFNFLMRLPDRPIARVPDLMYISSDRMDHLTDTYLDGPADLVIEVASVDSLVRDRRDKFLEYQAGGVREYWLIDEYHEEARFYVLDPAGQYEQASLLDDGIYASTVLPDLRLTVGKLWYEPFASFRNGLTGRSVDPTLPARREPVAIQVNDRRARERYAPNADGVFTSTVLPGLCLKVDWLWRDPLPTLDEALAELG